MNLWIMLLSNSIQQSVGSASQRSKMHAGQTSMNLFIYWKLSPNEHKSAKENLQQLPISVIFLLHFLINILYWATAAAQNSTAFRLHHSRFYPNILYFLPLSTSPLTGTFLSSDANRSRRNGLQEWLPQLFFVCVCESQSLIRLIIFSLLQNCWFCLFWYTLFIFVIFFFGDCSGRAGKTPASARTLVWSAVGFWSWFIFFLPSSLLSFDSCIFSPYIETWRPINFGVSAPATPTFFLRPFINYLLSIACI